MPQWVRGAPLLVAALMTGLLGGCAGEQGAPDDQGAPGAQSSAGAAQSSAGEASGSGQAPAFPGGAASPGPGGREWRTSGCATRRSPVMIRTAGATFPATDPQVEALAGQIQKEGQARFAAVYAGLEMVPEQVSMIVYRRPSADFDAYLRQQAGGECVTVRDAAHSAAELQALVERVSADMGYWRGRGIVINSVGPKANGSGIEVGTQNLAAVRVELPKRYGSSVPFFAVEQGPVAPLPMSVPAAPAR